ncbi:hypothetical protein CP97_14842 [Aurantiacibacter atlanticus]|uniref:Uncharacterized protein n=1 Tax=Aurantiacibacter atlanticus TaxID=1648404 RepID=A0A168M3D9_9SPHN|nr:hypothetical protein CP97_14842 [Aurantiacibacter atlanticus]
MSLTVERVRKVWLTRHRRGADDLQLIRPAAADLMRAG